MVRNIISYNGNAIPNQFIITTPKGTFFQSYNSIVCNVNDYGVVTLGKDWDYSNTTRKYLYQFLRTFGYSDLSRAKVLEMIKNKTFKCKKTNLKM